MLKHLSLLTVAFLLAFAMGCSDTVVTPDSADALGSSLKLDGAPVGGAPLTADLSSANEVPACADDATGSIIVTINPGRKLVCFDGNVTGANGDIFAAHIHDAPAGVAGPVVVPLNAALSGCTEVADRSLLTDIIANPEEYYVNVHSTNCPPGVARGQLTRPED